MILALFRDVRPILSHSEVEHNGYSREVSRVQWICRESEIPENPLKMEQMDIMAIQAV